MSARDIAHVRAVARIVVAIALIILVAMVATGQLIPPVVAVVAGAVRGRELRETIRSIIGEP